MDELNTDNGPVTIRYSTFDRQGRQAVKEKAFKTEKAMQSWVESQEANSGSFGEVLAYSYDRR